MDQEYREPKCLKRDPDPKPEALSPVRRMFARPLDPLGKGRLMVPTSHPPRPRNVAFYATYASRP